MKTENFLKKRNCDPNSELAISESFIQKKIQRKEYRGHWTGSESILSLTTLFLLKKIKIDGGLCPVNPRGNRTGKRSQGRNLFFPVFVFFEPYFASFCFLAASFSLSLRLFPFNLSFSFFSSLFSISVLFIFLFCLSFCFCFF